MEAQFHKLKFQKKKLNGLVIKTFAPDDRKKVIAALQFAEVKHQGQRRDEGTAYVIHPIRVAITLLQDVGTWDADAVVSALLHDVIEDCRVHLATIRKRFGKRVAQFVLALTRKRLRRESEAQKETDKLHKLEILSRAPLEVRLIKCADILDNLRCAADVPIWAWTALAIRKFPRWRREFHTAAEFAKGVHPVLHKEIMRALRTFEVKRIVRGVVRFKW